MNVLTSILNKKVIKNNNYRLVQINYFCTLRHDKQRKNDCLTEIVKN